MLLGCKLDNRTCWCDNDRSYCNQPSYYLSQAISTRKQGLKKYMAKHPCVSVPPYKWSPFIFGYLWPRTSTTLLTSPLPTTTATTVQHHIFLVFFSPYLFCPKVKYFSYFTLVLGCATLHLLMIGDDDCPRGAAVVTSISSTEFNLRPSTLCRVWSK